MVQIVTVGILFVAAVVCAVKTIPFVPLIIRLCIVICAGFLYCHAYVQWQYTHINVPKGKEPAFFATIVQEPESAGNFMLLRARLSPPYSGMIDIFASSHSHYDYGDFLWIKGTVIAENGGNAEAPAVFLPQIRVVAQHRGSWWQEFVIAIKTAIVKKFQDALPVDQAGLLGAIVIGSSSGIGTALKNQMEVSGTSYIVGMYGYKISIIMIIVSALLKDHVPRKVLLWVTLAIISLFVMATGATISAIRAAIMGSLALLAQSSGRVFNPRNALIFSALIMVLLNATLLTDAGFQLSFLSFAGIYYLGPPLIHIFHWEDKGIFMWKEHAMLSLATNLAILPIVMNTFGGFSLTSFISNILIMIPWPLVMAGGALLLGAGFVSSYLTFFVSQVVSILLRYELFIIHIFAAFVLPLPPIFGSPWAVGCYYGILIIFLYYYAPRSQKDN